jgi:flagellin-like protein
MKANRKFLNASHDEAVSPVIAVILMVAITVVLAATVYVWVSGFGSSSTSASKALTLSSASVLTGAAGSATKSYTVASATPGMKWSDITIAIDGEGARNHTVASTGSVSDGSYLCSTSVVAATTWVACTGSLIETSGNLTNAGDLIKLAGLTSGTTLRIIDAASNSQITSITVS